MKSPTSKDYRKAAELIFERKEEFACYALDAVKPRASRHEMWRLFADTTNMSSYWLTDRIQSTASCTPLGREVRIMALLFMSEITKGRGE